MDFLPVYLSTRVTLRRRSFICASCNSIVLYVFFFFFFFCNLKELSRYWGWGRGEQQECPWYYFTRAITLRVHQWEVNLFINPQCKFLPLSSAWIMPFIFYSIHQPSLYNLQIHNRTWDFEIASQTDVQVQPCMQIRQSFPINSRLVEYAH